MALIPIILLFSIFHVLVFGGLLDSGKSYVYGGIPVGVLHKNEYRNEGLFPYVASLELNGEHICGCAIYKKNVVITAAHCVGNIDKNNLQVRAGILNKGSTGRHSQIKKISKIIAHKKYNVESRRDNDIALLILTSDFEFGRYVNNIKLADPTHEEQIVGKKVYILGWGRTDNDERSPRLLKGSLKLLSFDQCNAFHKSIALTKSMVCAINAKGKVSMASGDSGGPLVHIYDSGNVILVGIASFMWKVSGKIPDVNRPTVFTDVAALKPWIKKNSQ